MDTGYPPNFINLFIR